ncbi:CoA pyrophosphatase [Noviherbaspirillum denitrificans]|uniref:Coenzyme A pyrophosphatase n=1 Tax=Noviherbaspirillum denitrificans TaxID=1968433 RepID=A0A254TLI4_9BURK|nr:CoA pyrophosphatase [Noviherbaspirillum denitrificans]OWW23087.1 coenzyme A pyrophosphatase [Noviherbaspirillum denitrificans]
MSKLLFDPEALPVESLAGEPAIDPERLNESWLRERFASPPVWEPERFEERLMRKQEGDPTPASVLIPIVVRDDGLTMLLTQRTAHLNDHAGQISLPGGRVDEADTSPIETALRETEEEVGLHRRHIDVLGTLPDYFTGTGFRVTPVVALVQPPFDLRADPFEVAEIFEVPLAFLLDGANHQRRSIEAPGMGKRTFYAMPYDRFFIWGATAGMLRNLFHFLRA